MAERARPDSKGFKDKFFGLIKSKYKENLFARYLLCNKYIKNKIVLDVPCGMGWGSSLLKDYKKLWGVDINKAAIEEAKKRYPLINFKNENMISLDFPKKFFDVVICLEGFEHITFFEGQKFLKESKRILKKGGLLIISTPLLRNNKYHSGNKYHLCEYKEDELYKVFSEAKFKIITIKNLKEINNTKVIICVLKSE